VTARPRILIADDDDDIRRILADVLDFEGFEVVEATNGVEALERLAEYPDFVAILSDWKMPKLDGPGLLKELGRRWPALASRIVFLSGAAIPDAPVLIKPFNLDEVLRVVREVAKGGCDGERPRGPEEPAKCSRGLGAIDWWWGTGHSRRASPSSSALG
jgi:CheY-like chemotaxis protein